MDKIFSIGIALAVIIIVIAALTPTKRTPTAGSFRARKLVSDNESEFFGRLVVALPEFYIFPQVAMSALLEPSSGIAKKAHSDFRKIAQQRVDYVIANKQMEVVAVVELDDITHSRAKDQLRDSRLEQAKIRTVRFQSKNKPNVAALRSAILGQTPVSDSISVASVRSTKS
ncbi:hypothetical protein RCH14_004431 [Massilia sp. MP_M2]|uniref:DUF2726 domain-containing protein n=1 Tax=Massilia sp. MP_M2 TaxID=3071713 RepID=UPI00319DBFDC